MKELPSNYKTTPVKDDIRDDFNQVMAGKDAVVLFYQMQVAERDVIIRNVKDEHHALLSMVQMTVELPQEKVRLDVEVTNLKQLLLNKDKTIQPGVSVKFLMVGETRSLVGYHLMAEDHSIQFWVLGEELWHPQQLQGSTLVGFRIFWKSCWNGANSYSQYRQWLS